MAKSILIVGGGIIGLCSAYYAAREGHAVTVVDADEEHAEGCSHGNAGMIVPSHFVPLAAPGMVGLGLRMMWHPESPFYIKPRLDWELWRWGWRFCRAANAAHVQRAAPLLRDLHLLSRQLFADLSNELPVDFGLARKGLLMLCKTPHGLEEEIRTAELAGKLGIPAEVLDPAQTARLDSTVDLDIRGAVYFPKDCHLSPRRLLAGLKQALKQHGTQFLWNRRVTGWRASGNHIAAAVTDRGELPADEFVLCAGAWSPLATRALRLRLPLQAGKGYSLTLRRPPQVPSICSILTEARVAVTPMGRTLRFAGTMEIAGLDQSIKPRRVQGIIKSVPEYFPKFAADDFKEVRPWQGLRPCSPDGLPYLGRTKRWRNLVVATGHAMMGLSLGPVTGQLVAQLLANQPPAVDLTWLNPERYA